MKFAILLAGGPGACIKSYLKPKAMIRIGGKPIIWRIMKIYSARGINDLIVSLGYKGCVAKEYLANYFIDAIAMACRHIRKVPRRDVRCCLMKAICFTRYPGSHPELAHDARRNDPATDNVRHPRGLVLPPTGHSYRLLESARS